MSHKGMTSWSGTCRSRAAQDRLLNWIDRLASGTSLVRRYDRLVRGAINPEVFPGRDRKQHHDDFVREMTQSGSPVIRGQQTPLALAREIYLRGIDFFPLHQYADGRLSFVFIESAELPQLNGRIVEVITPDELRQFAIPRLPSSNDDGPEVWEIRTPFFDSKYILADWLDWLLAWVESFYADDLVYERYRGVAPERFKEATSEIQTDEYDGAATPLAFAIYREHLRLAILEHGREEAENEGFGHLYNLLQTERRKYGLG